MRFEYDPDKSASNLAKHGIDFIQAQRLWTNPVLEIPAKPGAEMRYLCIGKIDGEIWSAIISYRGTARRIISVRRATAQEQGIYHAH